MVEIQRRDRLASAQASTFLAVLDGDDVGIVSGAVFRGHVRTAGLFGMWGAPAARGAGAGDRLVESVVDWAREHGFARVLLQVGDHNAAAIRLYRRNGFVPTGGWAAFPEPRDHIHEHELVL